MMTVVRDVMARNPDFVGPNETLQTAARKMRDGDYGALPVIDAQNVNDSGVLVGIVTDRDLAIKALAEGHAADTPVEHCMTRDPDMVAPDTPLAQAVIVMSSRQVRRLPVMEFGRLVGMLSLSDIAGSSLSGEEKAKALTAISSGGEPHTAGMAFDE
jgi:CBS domain-containing protein